MNAIMLCWLLKHLKTRQSYRTCWHWAYPLSSVVCCFSVGISNLGMPAHIKKIFFSAYIWLLDSAQEALQSCDSITSAEDLNFDSGVISCKLNFVLFGKVVRDVVEMGITRLPWVFFFFVFFLIGRGPYLEKYSLRVVSPDSLKLVHTCCWFGKGVWFSEFHLLPYRRSQY